MCLGRTHALAGATACAGFAAAVWHPGAGVLAAGVILCAGTGIVNDIDHDESTIVNTLGPVTRLLSDVVRVFTGGVPRRTHSLPVMALAMGLAWWQVTWYRHVPARLPLLHTAVPFRPELHAAAIVWLGLTITILMSGAVRALLGHDRLTGLAGHFNKHARRHGFLEEGRAIRPGFAADLFGAGAAIVAVHTGWGLPLLVPAVGFGMAVHIALDSCTDDGCPWLWPFISRDYHLPVPRFKTGGLFEHVLRWALTGALIYLLLIDTAPYFPGHGVLNIIHHHLEAL
jgi:membrane-bound metal-dependent hydrolase YbcI (DUF457 family)